MCWPAASMSGMVGARPLSNCVSNCSCTGVCGGTIVAGGTGTHWLADVARVEGGCRRGRIAVVDFVPLVEGRGWWVSRAGQAKPTMTRMMRTIPVPAVIFRERVIRAGRPLPTEQIVDLAIQVA